MFKLAALLVPDVDSADEVMCEAFAALCRERRRLRRPDERLAFLRRAVVCRARAKPSSRSPGKAAATPGRGYFRGPTAADAAATEVINALRSLPETQREAIVLRYYGQLSDTQAADAMGVRTVVLRGNLVRGMAALRAALGRGHRCLLLQIASNTVHRVFIVDR